MLGSVGPSEPLMFFGHAVAATSNAVEVAMGAGSPTAEVAAEAVAVGRIF